MAEAVVTFFLEKLSTLLTEEANLLSGVDEEVRLLQRKLEWISLSIRGSDIQRRSDPKVKLWVKQLREITFNAEDVIDEFMHKVDQRRHHQQRHHGRFTRSIVSCISSIERLLLRRELGNKIRVINTRADMVSKNQSDYGIQFDGDSSNQQAILPTVKRTLTLRESDMCGIKDGAKEVKSMLMRDGDGSDDRKRLLAVSIVGMGGLGKTTLARNVYVSDDIRRCFVYFSWVAISQEYGMPEIISSILITLMDKENEKLCEDLSDDIEKLRRILEVKKYLVVLDDVWDTDVWHALGAIFPDASNGSRILITTRKIEIAMHAGNSSSTNIYQLRLLDEAESWELFVSKIFSRSSGSTSKPTCPQNLEVVGKAMVEKCHGLPLAIIVLGGLLSRKNRELSTWSRVNDRLKDELIRPSSQSCYGILALSYYDLPYYLKPCFMYFGLFPEDCEIGAFVLYQRWIAEGFIQPRGGEQMEDVAEDFLEELIHRSLVQVGRFSSDGKVKTCRVHDILRDICIAEAKEDHFSQLCTSVDASPESNYVRRLVIQGGELDLQMSQFRYTPCVRSFAHTDMFTSSEIYKPFWRSLCGGFKLLKLLSLKCRRSGACVPQQLGELIHLRYLRLDGFVMSEASLLSALINLQTLDLGGSSFQGNLIHILGLHQLRHVYVPHIAPQLSRSLRKRMIISNDRYFRTGNLTNLRTLVVQAGDWLLHFGGWNALRMLRFLHLIGKYSYKMETLVSISRLTSLRSLKLDAGADGVQDAVFSSLGDLVVLFIGGQLPTPFSFPPKLTRLELERSACSGQQLIDAIGELKDLKRVRLMGWTIADKKIKFSAGTLLQLQFLEISCQDKLEEVVVEEGALVNLTHLDMQGCYQLKMVPDGVRTLKLQELNLILMSREFQRRLEKNVGEDWDKIKHIPYVHF